MKIEIKTGGSAFCDENGKANDEYAAMECARLLKRVVNELNSGYTHGSIIDINGNKVGRWEL